MPLEDLTILVSPELDKIVGIDVQDLQIFVSRYVASELIPSGLEGPALFDKAERHIERLTSMFLANLGPVAKDHVARWDEQVESILLRRSAH